jgi:hypothetical protein
MTEVENYPVALGDRSFVKGLGPNEAISGIGARTNVNQHLRDMGCRGRLCGHRLASPFWNRGREFSG